MIPCQKDKFNIPEYITYLNCAYMSPQLHQVEQAGREAAQRKSHPWEITPHDFFNESEIARGLFARLLEASPEDVALVPSASFGISTAARNLPVQKGQRILVLADQFPSNVYPWQELTQETGAELEALAWPTDHNWTGRLLERIKKKVAVVALPHCHWTNGDYLDLRQISLACQKVGAALVVDATQSLGALPLNVKEVQADFIVSAAYKWLLGPYSLGFMYVHPKHHQGRPLDYSWINRRGSEDFSKLVHYQPEYRAGARRFDVGEHANFALMPAAIAALNQLLQWQVPDIALALSQLTDQAADLAQALGLVVSPKAVRSPHMLGVHFPKGLPDNLMPRLVQERIYVSIRGDSMRISPHLYNDLEDLERLFDLLGQML